MRAALRIIRISLRVRIRSITGWGWVVMAAGGILVPVLTFSMGKSVAWSSPGPQYLLPFLTGALNVLLIMQLGAAFSTAFSHLYLARDLPLFLVSPVRPRSVILAKLLEVAVAGIIAYAVAGIPLLVSLGVAWYAPPWYYVLSILAGLAFALIPAILAVLANLLVCRILPPYRAKEFTAALSTLIGAITYFFLRMAVPTTGWGTQPGDMSGVSSVFGRLGPAWSPSVLLARAAIEGLFERPVPLIVTAATLILVSTGLSTVVLRGTERAYLSGWMVSGEIGTKRRKRLVARRHFTMETQQARPEEFGSSPSSTPGALDDSEETRRQTPRRARLIVAGSRLPALNVERTSFAVESKLLLRDLQSQSQVIYVLVMVLALTLFPGRSAAQSMGWLNSFGPFVFLAMAGSYASWAVKNMPTTVGLLGQFPVDPTRVMRGKALFYGLIQAGCALILFVLIKVFGSLAPGQETPMLLVIWTALAFSTGATSVCAAAYDYKTVESTGVPKLGVAGAIALNLVNAGLAGICFLGYLIAAATARTRPATGWVWVTIVVGAQMAAFFTATNMAGNRVRKTAVYDDVDDENRSESRGATASGKRGDSAGKDRANSRNGGNSIVRILIAFLVSLSCLAGSASAAPATASQSTASTVGPTSINDIPCHEVNGAKVYIVRLPEDKQGLAQIGAVMLAGTADQREDETHCAHMAEHMALMYPSSSGESVWSIAAESYSLGSVPPLQGATGSDFTGFVMAVPGDKTLHTLSVFLDSLFRPTLTDDSAFRMEIKRSRRELTVMTTDKETALINKLRLGMYRGTCYWEDLFGTPLTAVSADKIRRFMEREYTPARLSLVVLSDCGEKEILDCVARCLQSIPPGEGPSEHVDARFDPPRVEVLEIKPDKQRAGLAVGVSGVSPEDMSAVEALLNIATKRLYTGFRRDLGVKMETSLHHVLITESTAVATYVFTASTSAQGTQSIEQAVDEIAAFLRETLASLTAEGPSLDELRRFTLPGSRQSQVSTPVISPYSDVEMLATQLIPVGNFEDLLAESDTSPGTYPEDTRAVLKTAAVKYLPDAKVTVVYVRDPSASTATWVILGGAFVGLVAAVWWKVARSRGSRRLRVGD